MILAIAKIPDRADALLQAAALTGLQLADVRLRLNGTLPRVLLTDAHAERIIGLGARLTEAGFVILTCPPSEIPSDADRIVAQTLEFHPEGFVAIDHAHGLTPGRLPERHLCWANDIVLLQRGLRAQSSTEVLKTVEEKFSAGRAALTGGLLLTKKVDKTITRGTEAREPFILVQRGEGQQEIILYESRLDYHFLGADLQPATHGNLLRTLSLLRALCPQVPVDERASRPAFVKGLPASTADQMDLALRLVKLMHLRNVA